jgi:hypothetical protein
MANILLGPQPDFAAMATSYQSLAPEVARIPNTPQFTAGNAILDQLHQINTAVQDINTRLNTLETRLDTAVQDINTRLDTTNTAIQIR